MRILNRDLSKITNFYHFFTYVEFVNDIQVNTDGFDLSFALCNKIAEKMKFILNLFNQ